MNGSSLPLVLAGPILRRCDENQVVIWVATSKEVQLEAEIINPRMIGNLAQFEIQRVKLGQKLFVHLMKATPKRSKIRKFPTEQILRYDIFVANEDGEHEIITSDLGLGTGAVIRSPTFMIKSENQDLRVLYGSCRKLHGEGEDAIPAAFEIVQQNASDPVKRPQILFLTGDQIYADDVSDLMLGRISELATELTGTIEKIPDLELDYDVIGGRQQILQDKAKLTSSHAANHVVRFGEFAALYLLSWNPGLWDIPTLNDIFSKLDETSYDPTIHAYQRQAYRLHYDKEKRKLDDSKRSTVKLRKLLANIPTYMGFDDHEVTDDWYLNETWTRNVLGNSSGRRIIANGLAAFWVFQAWGNDPSYFENQDFIEPIKKHLNNYSESTAGEYENTVLGFNKWTFTTPTVPKVVFVDTRTQRGKSTTNRDKHNGEWIDRPPFISHEARAILDFLGFDVGSRLPPQSVPRLMDTNYSEVFQRVLSNSYIHERTDPLILVTPSPVIGATLTEQVQNMVIRYTNAKFLDFESWVANPRSFLDMMSLIKNLRHRVNIILSGDVHFAFAATMYMDPPRENNPPNILQFTSSATKNKSLPIDIPQSKGPYEKWWWLRESNTGPVESYDIDPKDYDSSGSLVPNEVRGLGEPDFKLRWRYITTNRLGKDDNTIIPNNNIGYLSIWSTTHGRNQLWTMQNNNRRLIQQYEW